MRKRSRFGCRNCKIRKLKCDENKPQCKRCTAFGVLCNFVPHVPDLQAGTFRELPSLVWTSDSFQLNTRCQDFISRYLRQSLVTDVAVAQVNRRLLELAFHHPFLMHASLAVAFAYDRYLNCSPRSLEECRHWAQSTALFNKRLREPIAGEARDAVWGTAAALALLALSPDVRTPEESWPLEGQGLEWLRMNEGKMSLWRVVDPLRPDSIFRIMAPTYAEMNAPLTKNIPTDLADLLSEPYLDAARAVSLDVPARTGQAMLFMLAIRGPFKMLLQQKDPVALLLLYLWYRNARTIWWIDLRARVECPAILLYLRRHHADSAVVAYLDALE